MQCSINYKQESGVTALRIKRRRHVVGTWNTNVNR